MHNGVTILKKEIWLSSKKICLSTDAAQSKGFAAVFGDYWATGSWDDQVSHLHITILELYPIVLSLYLWGNYLKDKCVIFLCDNQAVVDILNSQTSKDKVVMILVRQFVLLCLKFNIWFRLKHIKGKHNTVPDCLSRFQVHKARQHQPTLKATATPVPLPIQLSTLLSSNYYSLP